MWSKKFTLTKLILSSCVFIQKIHCEDSDSSLYGTWSSKSNQVFTGPGFYDPIDELLIEPSLPGISYSFTEDGWYEEASYQVSGNPRDPTCPMASLIYQHGKYVISDNGTLVLNPIEVDGRQLFSDPCNDDGVSTYSRYNQNRNVQRIFCRYRCLPWYLHFTTIPIWWHSNATVILGLQTTNDVTNGDLESYSFCYKQWGVQLRRHFSIFQEEKIIKKPGKEKPRKQTQDECRQEIKCLIFNLECYLVYFCRYVGCWFIIIFSILAAIQGYLFNKTGRKGLNMVLK